MEKINFEDLPSTETPINSSNLNLLQDNVENEINEKESNLQTQINEKEENLQSQIDGIVETGFNDNGSWVKFANGTMICTKKTSLGGSSTSPTVGINVDTGSNNNYRSEAISIGGFPQTFTEVYYNVSTFVAAQGFYNIWQSNSPANGEITTYFPPVILMSNTSINVWGVYIYSLAIGKWK